MDSRTLSLVTLQFHDRDLERQFGDFAVQPFTNLDEKFFRLDAVASALVGTLAALGFIDTTQTGRVWLYATISLLAVLGLLLYVLPRSMYCKWRTWLMLALRLGFATTESRMVKEFFQNTKPSAAGLLTRLTIASGTGALIWTSTGIPLKFSLFAPLQVATLLRFMYVVNGKLCGDVLRDEQVFPVMETAWSAVNVPASALLQMYLPVRTNETLPVATLEPLQVVCQQCMTLVQFIQVVLGLVLPLLLQYHSEWNLRCMFLLQLHPGQGSAAAAQALVTPVPKLALLSLLSGALPFAVLLLWEFCKEATAIAALFSGPMCHTEC